MQQLGEVVIGPPVRPLGVAEDEEFLGLRLPRLHPEGRIDDIVGDGAMVGGDGLPARPLGRGVVRRAPILRGEKALPEAAERA